MLINLLPFIGAQSHYAQPFTVFTFIKSHANDTKLLQNYHTHLYTPQTVSYNSPVVYVGDFGLMELLVLCVAASSLILEMHEIKVQGYD